MFCLHIHFCHILSYNSQTKELYTANKNDYTDYGCPACHRSPNNNLRMTIISRMTKEHSVMQMPNLEDILMGACKKFTMPSIAYLNNFQKSHFVSPATLSTFSNVSQYVLNPIHPNIPFEKRLYPPYSQ